MLPRRETWDPIAQTVGDAPDDLDFWRQVLVQWVGLGWNPLNVLGPLEWFRKRQLPQVERTARAVHPAPPAEMRPLADREAVLARLRANQAKHEPTNVNR